MESLSKKPTRVMVTDKDKEEMTFNKLTTLEVIQSSYPAGPNRESNP